VGENETEDSFGSCIRNYNSSPRVFWEALYGAGPVTRYMGVIHLAITGTIVLAAACILSLFTLRLGAVFALAGSVLAWPYFAIQMPKIPWGSIVSVLPHANWHYELTTIVVLVVSTGYSANHLWLLRRGRDDLDGRKMGFELVAALLYAIGIFGLSNWRTIWDWLFRLRYGS
jgi:hypothetical protein